MDPWTRPIFDIFYEHYKPKEIEKMIFEKKIEISPLCFMRGRTFKNSLIIGDEMQNSIINQMKMFLTRIGEKSKMIITGDLEQIDRIDNSGLKDLINKLQNNNIKGIGLVYFEDKDIKRHEIIKDIINLYK